MNSDELMKIIEQLKEWGNINAASHFLIKKICIHNNWPYGEFWMPDKTGTYMTWCGYWSLNGDDFESFSKFSSIHKFAKGLGVVGKTWQDKNLFLSDKIHDDKVFLRSDQNIKEKLNTAIGIPILKGNLVSMILSFFKNGLTESDRETASQIFNCSSQIGEILFK